MGARGDGLDGIQEARPLLLEYGLEDLFLVLEVVVDQAVGDARLARDVGDTRLVIAGARKDLGGGLQNQAALVTALASAIAR